MKMKLALCVLLLSVAAQAQWLQNVTVSGVTPTAATASWLTGAQTTSSVSWGPTTNYGSITGNPAFAGSHSLPLTGLSPNQQYHYAVSSVDNTGAIVTSLDHVFMTPASPPPTFSVALNWAPGASVPGVTVTGYNIYRGTATGGPYTLVGTSTNPPFTDINVPAHDTLFYVVDAVATGVQSGNSNEFTITVP